MIGIDTNVLVRYLAQDDRTQSPRATSFIEKECSVAAPGFVGLVVLAEVVCERESLRRSPAGGGGHRAQNPEHPAALVVQDAETAWKALRLSSRARRTSPIVCHLHRDCGRVRERGDV